MKFESPQQEIIITILSDSYYMDEMYEKGEVYKGDE
jgi:hypothetical protein